jgi:ABC-2 type transport system ATP-binding protein
MNGILHVNDLHLGYAGGVKALDGVGFSVGEELVGLLGPNGAGKTTLLKVLSRRLRPLRGTGTLMGISLEDPATRVAWLEKMSYLPQEEEPPHGLTGWEVVDTALRLSRPGWPTARRKAQVEMALRRVGLLEAAGRRAQKYSGGMKRRLGLARALAPEPDLLLVDEPTSGLDPQERVAFRELLSSLAEVSSVLISTHITADVEVSCSRVIVLYGGRVLYDGQPSELIRDCQGKVMAARLTKSEMETVAQRYRVVTIIPEREHVRIRYFISENGPGPGEAVNPTLEEAYLHLVGRHGALEVPDHE